MRYFLILFFILPALVPRAQSPEKSIEKINFGQNSHNGEKSRFKKLLDSTKSFTEIIKIADLAIE